MPIDPVAELHRLGDMAMTKGDYERANTYFSNALKLNPNDDYSREQLQAVAHQTKQPGKQARKALQIPPSPARPGQVIYPEAADGNSDHDHDLTYLIGNNTNVFDGFGPLFRAEDPAVLAELARNPEYQAKARTAAEQKNIIAKMNDEYRRLEQIQEATPDQATRASIQIEKYKAENARQTAMGAVRVAEIQQQKIKDEIVRKFVSRDVGQPVPPLPPSTEGAQAQPQVGR
jgi:tetratricopeptide (TPR) repeat protein